MATNYLNEKLSKFIKENNSSILILSTQHCTKCKMQKVMIENLLKKDDGVDVVEVDLMKRPDIARDLKVATVPVILFVKNHVVASRFDNNLSPEEFNLNIITLLYN